MKKSILIMLLLILGATITSCEKQELNSQKEDDSINSYKRPTVSFALGLSAVLHKPSRECKFGFGMCRVTFLVIGIDWVDQALGDNSEINLGVDSENKQLIIEFMDPEFHPESLGQEFMQIDEGDELIQFDASVIDHFLAQGVDLTNLRLIEGQYSLEYNVLIERYSVRIDFTQ